jgi:hypothetical protein
MPHDAAEMSGEARHHTKDRATRITWILSPITCAVLSALLVPSPGRGNAGRFDLRNALTEMDNLHWAWPIATQASPGRAGISPELGSIHLSRGHHLAAESAHICLNPESDERDLRARGSRRDHVTWRPCPILTHHSNPSINQSIIQSFIQSFNQSSPLNLRLPRSAFNHLAPLTPMPSSSDTALPMANPLHSSTHLSNPQPPTYNHSPRPTHNHHHFHTLIPAAASSPAVPRSTELIIPPHDKTHPTLRLALLVMPSNYRTRCSTYHHTFLLPLSSPYPHPRTSPSHASSRMLPENLPQTLHHQLPYPTTRRVDVRLTPT